MYQETKDSLFTAPQLRWGVIGCGVIANQMAEALAAEGRHIDGVANRTHEKAVAFADKHGVARVYDTIDDLIAAPDIDVLYLTTPHNTHITYLRKALAAGKHVLCEKSITLNSAELAEARELASAHGVQLMDACTILHMPLYKELQRRIDAGDFGRVNLIQENFGSYKEYDMKNRFFNPELAGGALLDIGVYSLTLARLFLKSQPHEALSMMNPAPTGTDETEGILLRNAEGQMVVLSLTMHSKQPKRAMISADKAYLEIMEYPRADRASIVWTETGVREELQVGNTVQALSYVLADMERAVAGDEYARAQLGTSADVMELMTNLRADWNFKYPEEL
ncbi:Gfo/Idh/MocA family oxidoreductase [Lancefieldella rimae]|uniref:Gfo/Idh/MocA family protein n=1 Tax=Lancefieldella rimae TaxID=1383 RepID=UPI0028E86D12|nr:Gfo/Idh/MocA family oxidoreductase [Lancefieldella rimae]